MDLSRRQFLTRGIAALAITQTACFNENCDPCEATNTCPSPVPDPPTLRTARVNMTQLEQAISTQQCELWCWAASISMIFDFYRHPVSQATIVAATYGNVLCLPANSTTTIGRDLSRPWIDARGVPFTSQVVAAYDYFNGFNTFAGNAEIINALEANNPMLYCNRSHAMVLYSVSYMDTPFGPDVRQASVVDPWPSSPRTHALSTEELYPAHSGGAMTFLAQVSVR